MKAFLASILCLGLCLGSLSAADITVKEEPVPVNSFARVTIKIEKGQNVLWDVYPEPVASEEFNTATEGKLFFSGPRGTKYKVRVTVLSIKDGQIVTERSTKTVTMAVGEDPDPVDPDNPNPPTPPDVGAATLSSKLKAAFKLEVADEKPFAPKLADLYAKYGNESELAKYTTWGALETAMRADAKAYGVGGKLIKTQTEIHNYLSNRIPFGREGWENVVIEDSDRKKVKSAFTTISSAVGKLK